jgi:hypothetical protein
MENGSYKFNVLLLHLRIRIISNSFELDNIQLVIVDVHFCPLKK